MTAVLTTACSWIAHLATLIALANPVVPLDRAERIARVARTATIAYDLPQGLLLAVADRESQFDVDAVSSTGDWGVWQLNPRTRWGRRAAAWCDVDPSDCLLAQAMEAAYLLREERTRCRSWRDALGAYHTGVCESETGRKYAARVLKGWRKWKE